ncbi:MAG: hypothetical protein CFE31_01705 [Rhizobiales bacterium PAR1]|nr:MAG: hypothetical protein CFE31_01705 [Rhizobiales bacterium PAR1]
MSEFLFFLFEVLIQKRLIRRIILGVLSIWAIYTIKTSTKESWIALGILAAVGLALEIADYWIARRRGSNG